MSRVHDYLELIDNPGTALTAPEPTQVGDDEVLLALLVHLAFADGVVEGDEFALLRRVRPDMSDNDLMMWTMETAGAPMDWDALVAALPDPASRWAGLRFAARMVCLDGNVADDEIKDLRILAERLMLDATTVQRAVDEVVARVDHASPDALAAALRMLWDELVPDRDDLESDLAGVVPDGAQLVCRVLLHGTGPGAPDEEVAALFQGGLAGRFDQGPRFVAWTEIERYTRVPVPGAAFHLHTDQGHLAMSDPRLRDLGKLLDVVYGRSAPAGG